MKLIFAGSGEFGLPTLKAILGAGHEVELIVTQPDRPAGRGKHITPTPIAALAQERGLEVLKSADINAAPLPAADVMVVIAFGQKIGPHVVDHPRLGSVNLHGSRLPKYRGAAPVNWAILKGETITGNSIIRLAQRMDAGAILGQSELPIGELETAGELHDRLAEDGAGLMLDVLKAIEEGRAIERPQDDSQATVAPKLNRAATRIDWLQPAEQIANQIRGLFPWPGCRVRTLSPAGDELSRVTLIRASRVLRDLGLGLKGTDRGTILDNGEVFCRPGLLAIHELQPEGKRPMSLNDYRNGHPWEPGMRLESIV